MKQRGVRVVLSTGTDCGLKKPLVTAVDFLKRDVLQGSNMRNA